MDESEKQREGLSRFSMKRFSSNSTEKFRRGTLRFKKVLVSKLFFIGGKIGNLLSFLSLNNENCSRRTLLWFRKIPISKFPCIRVGYHVFASEFLLSHSTEKWSQRDLSAFQKKIPLSLHFTHRRGTSRFSVGNILSHSTEKTSRVTFLSFRNSL